MKIRLPIMIQDPKLSGHPDLKRIVERPYVDEDIFTDGPACKRVAVHDLDPATGRSAAGSPLPAASRRPQAGPLSDRRREGHLHTRLHGGQRVRHGAAHHPHVRGGGHPRPAAGLGLRRATTAHRARAGEQANAFYGRDTHSLKFCYFANPHDPAHPVYTALSRDIVCHETGHAILDGIAPHLLYAKLDLAPQAYALHESIADLVAVVMSFRSGNLREAILKETRGSIDDVSAFSSIGEEFGQAAQQPGLPARSAHPAAHRPGAARRWVRAEPGAQRRALQDDHRDARALVAEVLR